MKLVNKASIALLVCVSLVTISQEAGLELEGVFESLFGNGAQGKSGSGDGKIKNGADDINSLSNADAKPALNNGTENLDRLFKEINGNETAASKGNSVSDTSELDNLFGGSIAKKTKPQEASQSGSELNSLFQGMFSQGVEEKVQDDTSEVDELFDEVFEKSIKRDDEYAVVGQSVSDSENKSIGSSVLQELFSQLQSTETFIDRERLLSEDREADLLGALLLSIEAGEKQDEKGVDSLLATVKEEGKEFNDEVTLDIFAATLALVPTEEDSIFEPTPSVYSFRDVVEERKGHYGVSAIYRSSSGYADGMVLSGLVRHILTNKLYALAEFKYSLSPLSNPDIGAVSSNTSFYGFSAGAEYAVMRGLKGIDESNYTPWEMTIKSTVGQQYTSGSQGVSLDLSGSLIFHFDDYWVSGEVGYFYVEDEVLNNYQKYKGTQVGVSLGLYY